MAINVIDSENRVLAPTNKLKWVEKMVFKETAKYVNNDPPTIQLNYAVPEPKRDPRR